MKKIFYFISLLFFLTAQNTFAGFGDNTFFKNSNEGDAAAQPSEENNSFSSSDQFGKSNFSSHDVVMDAGDGGGPPPPPPIPLDGGASLILISGALVGLKKLFSKK